MATFPTAAEFDVEALGALVLSVEVPEVPEVLAVPVADEPEPEPEDVAVADVFALPVVVPVPDEDLPVEAEDFPVEVDVIEEDTKLAGSVTLLHERS